MLWNQKSDFRFVKWLDIFEVSQESHRNHSTKSSASISRKSQGSLI
jgi:hypothetical protein